MNLKPIVFIDTEIEPKSGKVLDIGGVKGVGSSFHSNSLVDFAKFLYGSDYVCGHNIFNHDLKYIRNALIFAGIDDPTIIDTLFLSPLLFPAKPYHKLVKDDKLQTEDTKNPLNDSIKAKDLYFDEIAAFQQTDANLQLIFYQLLRDQKEFSGFFHFLGYEANPMDIEKVIREKFHSQICASSDLARIIVKYPIELSYCLALINTDNRYSITPPWVLKNYPAVERIMFLLRSCPCLTGCAYCDQALDVRLGLKRFFGFENYRTYAGEPLQKNAVQAAVDNKSLLAVFPTGGGKSITFQVPALMSGSRINNCSNLNKFKIQPIIRKVIIAMLADHLILDFTFMKYLSFHIYLIQSSNKVFIYITQHYNCILINRLLRARGGLYANRGNYIPRKRGSQNS